MGPALAILSVIVLIVGLFALLVYELKWKNADVEKAKAEAAAVDKSTEEVVDQAAALEKKLKDDEATRAADAATQAETSARIAAEIKKVEGGSDAALDGYLIDRGLVSKPK